MTLATEWKLRTRVLDITTPRIMGIVNVTPDSFSDGGLHATKTEAVAFAHRLVEEGADIIDVGGESTRPGAADVSPEEELDASSAWWKRWPAKASRCPLIRVRPSSCRKP